MTRVLAAMVVALVMGMVTGCLVIESPARRAGEDPVRILPWATFSEMMRDAEGSTAWRCPARAGELWVIFFLKGEHGYALVGTYDSPSTIFFLFYPGGKPGTDPTEYATARWHPDQDSIPPLVWHHIVEGWNVCQLLTSILDAGTVVRV